MLAGLKAPLGVHAILGNHDWWEDKTVQRDGQGLTVSRRALEAAGIPVYENDVARLTKDGRSFWLAGLGDQLAYMPARRFRPVKRIGVDDLAATLGKVTDDAPIILLAHEPDIAARVPSRVALQLSGHTHGGQVRLFGWSPVVPSRRQLAYGHIRMNCDVVVSGGLGCSIMPFRLGVPPEIVLVTLGGTAGCVVVPRHGLSRRTRFAQNDCFQDNPGTQVSPLSTAKSAMAAITCGSGSITRTPIFPASSITPIICASWNADAPIICG